MISYEIITLALAIIGAIIKFSMDYSKLRTRLDEHEKEITDLNGTKKGISELEKTVLRVETKLDLIMKNFELTIKE